MSHKVFEPSKTFTEQMKEILYRAKVRQQERIDPKVELPRPPQFVIHFDFESFKDTEIDPAHVDFDVTEPAQLGFMIGDTRF